MAVCACIKYIYFDLNSEIQEKYLNKLDVRTNIRGKNQIETRIKEAHTSLALRCKTCNLNNIVMTK